MTTPSVDREPVSVEPMTDDIAGFLVDLHAQANPIDDTVTISVEAAETLCRRLADLLVRALPLPRRYTGGPLEDGLYLWREIKSSDPQWFSVDTRYEPIPNRRRPWPIKEMWLIGPITIPDIPSEEATP